MSAILALLFVAGAPSGADSVVTEPRSAMGTLATVTLVGATPDAARAALGAALQGPLPR